MGHRVLAKEQNPARCSFYLLLMVRAKAAGIFFLPPPPTAPLSSPANSRRRTTKSRQSKCFLSSSRINKDEHPNTAKISFCLSVCLTVCLSVLAGQRNGKKNQELVSSRIKYNKDEATIKNRQLGRFLKQNLNKLLVLILCLLLLLLLLLTLKNHASSFPQCVAL